MITRPTGMTLPEWADRISFDLSDFGVTSKLMGDDWQNWAVQFLNNVDIGRNLPNPYNFDNWAEWAERFCETSA